MKPKKKFLMAKVWSGSKSHFDHPNLYEDLIREVKHAAPSAQLSYSLRCRLERCDRETRSQVCSQKYEGCSPLFIACQRGNAEIVEYLISVCGADMEMKGVYQVPDDQSEHAVTPLWAAGVAGKAKIVEILMKYGADINAVSDSGSTPVRSACFMTHFDVVKILVERGADIQKPNYNGGTCLINSVQSVELSEFLLMHGADVNAQDVQKKTALHYAIQEHRFETTKMLLKYGANPHLTSRYQDDGLQTACLKGASDIVNYLVNNIQYSPERVASAFELLGSTYMDEHHDMQKTLQYWKSACDLRSKFKITKEIKAPKDAYGKMSEFQSKEDLDSMSHDLDYIRYQSLIVTERVLGTQHKDMIYRLMYRGASYADSLFHQSCVDLWKYALELRIAKDSVISSDTCFTAQALARLFMDLYEKSSQGLIMTRLEIEDVMSSIELIATDVGKFAHLLEVQPRFKRQQESFDKVILIIVHLIYLLTKLAESSEAKHEVKRRLHTILMDVNPKNTNGNTLLHLSVSDSTHINLFDDKNHQVFPSYEVTKLLLECGANPNAMNEERSTPLHTRVMEILFIPELAELLLAHGAHVDVKNIHGDRPSDVFNRNRVCKINPLQYQSLKCLAAIAISKHGISYRNEVPKDLEEFVEAH